MEIINKRPDELRGYERNARTHSRDQVKQIAASITAFGFNNPILIDGSGMVIAGHGRLAASIDLGRETVPCVVLDHLSDAEKRAYILADNKLAALAGWDDDLLRLELGELKGDVDIELIGFDADELDGLLNVQQGGGITDPDDVPETPEEPITKIGDIWILGKHRLMCGDSTNAAMVARLMDGNKVALVLADPPYFGKVEEEWDNKFAGLIGFLDFLRQSFSIWEPIIIDRGTSGWWCAPDYAWHIEGLLREYFMVFNHIVWSKGASMGTTVCVEDMRRWRPRSERLLLCEKQHSPDALLASFNAKTAHIAARASYAAIIDRLIAWKDESGLTSKEIDRCLGTNGMAGHYFGRSQWSLPTKEAWDKLHPLFLERNVDIGPFDEQRREFDGQRREFDGQRREFDGQRMEFDRQRREFDGQRMDNLTDVWVMTEPRGDDRHGHSTPKPVAIISKLVSAHSRNDDFVADPFLGSGTSIISCEQLGRTCYGMELSPKYCDVIVNRWQNFTGQRATHAVTGRLFGE
jgi:DNA modification methylase